METKSVSKEDFIIEQLEDIKRNQLLREASMEKKFAQLISEREFNRAERIDETTGISSRFRMLIRETVIDILKNTNTATLTQENLCEIAFKRVMGSPMGMAARKNGQTEDVMNEVQRVVQERMPF